MSWVRIDDHFYDHPKWATAPGDSIALWVAAMAWCNRNGSFDGFIPTTKLAGLVNIRSVTRSAKDLVERHALETTDDGYLIHEYAEYQQNEKVKAIREKRSKAGRKGASVRWGTHGSEIAKDMPNPMANAIANDWQTDSNENAPRPTTHVVGYISDDDDSVDTPGQSSSVEAIIATTAKAIALKDRDNPPSRYVNGIAKNIRIEQMPLVNACIAEHLSLYDSALRLGADPWFAKKALNGSHP